MLNISTPQLLLFCGAKFACTIKENNHIPRGIHQSISLLLQYVVRYFYENQQALPWGLFKIMELLELPLILKSHMDRTQNTCTLHVEEALERCKKGHTPSVLRKKRRSNTALVSSVIMQNSIHYNLPIYISQSINTASIINN